MHSHLHIKRSQFQILDEDFIQSNSKFKENQVLLKDKVSNQQACQEIDKVHQAMNHSLDNLFKSMACLVET